MNGLAQLYGFRARTSRPESLYPRCVAAQRRVLGEEHPEPLSTISNLAVSTSKEGRFAQAEPLLTRTT